MRNPIFDIMKFIAIIAMIVGHCAHDWRQGLVYTWHMPLFFMIGGYFFKPQPMLQSIKYNFRRLLVPYIVTALILIVVLFFKQSPQIFEYHLTSLITGSTMTEPWDIIFPIWFLFSLFMCSITFNAISHFFKSNIWKSIIVVSITTICYILAKMGHNNIPFTLIQSGCALIFFHIGYLFNKYDSITPKSHTAIWWIGAITFIIISYFEGGLNIAGNRYSNIIINILGAMGGTFIVMQASYYFHISFPNLSKKIAFLGSHSLLILIIHTLDANFGFAPGLTAKLFFFIENIGPNIAEQIIFSLIVSLLLYQIPIVRRVLRLSKPQYIDIKTSKS